MKPLSIEQDYQRWVRAVELLNKRHWECINGWTFRSPMGTKHDLSAANLSKEALEIIQDQSLFLAK